MVLKTGQFAELVAAVVRAIPKELNSTTAQAWIDNPAVLRHVLGVAMGSYPKEKESLLAGLDSLRRAVAGTLEPDVKNDSDAIEKNIIEDALKRSGHDDHRAAKLLGVSVPMFRDQRRKYKL